MKILIAVNPFLSDLREYKGFDFEVNPWGGDPTSENIEKALSTQNYSGLILGTKKLSNSVVTRCPTLKTIARVGVGVDNIDIEHFKKYGVIVTNTPFGPTDSTAEQAVSLILAALKKIPKYNSDMHSGIWKREMGKRLADCTVGIIGTGRIGKRVAELLNPFHCKILLNDEYQDKDFEKVMNAKYVDKKEMLKSSDIITFHCSLTDKSKNWISYKEADLLKEDVIIVNAARGELVNEDAIYNFLTENPKSVYCADVYKQEPYNGSLLKPQNVILTPHTSTFTVGAKLETERQALENCIEVLKEKKCDYEL